MSHPSDLIARLRVLDANANRAGEGLRVVEEYARFALDDRYLTELLKSIRHDLTNLLRLIPLDARYSARDTIGDVGTTVTTESEAIRKSAREVAEASIKRSEQALRAIEEYSKCEFPQAAAAAEQLRYRLYTVARALRITATSIERLADSRLYVLVDGAADSVEFERRVGLLLAADAVDVIQLRDKRLDDRSLLERARTLHELTRPTQTLFVMNDRPDLAVLSRADGVHVGQEELSVRDVRQIVGPEMLVGVSTHSLSQARAAVLDGANYIGCGPTFRSTTKSFDAFTGLELLREVAAEIRLPAFSIGGIDATNVRMVVDVGMRRIAVAGAVWNAADPPSAARDLKRQLVD